MFLLTVLTKSRQFCKEHKSSGMYVHLSAAAGFSSLIFSIASRVDDLFLLANITWHPCKARERAVSNPIPVFEPVTIAYLLLKSTPCKTYNIKIIQNIIKMPCKNPLYL